MVKHIFHMMLTAACMFSPAVVYAGMQSAEEARKVAADFFREGDAGRLSDAGALVLVHTGTDGGTPSYYVFNAADGNGFVIVSADDTVSPVIGYSTSSVWMPNSVPAETAYLLERAGKPGLNTVKRVISHSANTRKLLPTAPWSQEAPFNNNVPNRRLVGCVGTALAEILKYHEYPAARPSSLCKDGEAVDYDWSNMRNDNYRAGYSAAEADAVATLVADAAVAIGTDFGMSSSSAFEVKVPAALVETFGYDAGVSYKKGGEMDRSSWDALIMNEIDEGRPVLYSGQDLSAGHAFVCDGYEMHGQTPYFHINWGWGGSADGFYASDALNPTVSASHSFNNLTTIVYNIKPAVSKMDWSPVHITGDGNQAGLTMDVSDLSAGADLTIRAGALKNISGHDFSGNVSAAVFSADGSFKKLLGEGRSMRIMSLQIVNYTDLSFTVPSDADIAEGDVVRLVTRESADSRWLPVANDLITVGAVSARGYIPPYVDVDISNADSDVEVVCGEPRVIKGRDFIFKVISSSADKVVSVKANGFILTPDADNNYRIMNVNADQNVTVIAQNASDVVSKRNLWVQAGNLKELISDTDAATITDLTLFGTVDATDFEFMRDRMKLTRLDISCTSITASGANPANAVPAKAFSDCGSLRQIILPKNITTFKSGCFRNSGLESVEIPASVATYEYNVFVNCSRLREVTVRRSAPSWVNWCVFHGTPKTRLVVPVGASAAYKNKDYWKDFASIEEENPAPVSHFNVIAEDVPGLRIVPVSGSTQVSPGAEYLFTVETDGSFGDATMEIYANSTRIRAGVDGVYKAAINANTLIHAKFRQPEVTGESPWKITSAASGIGLVTDVVNVVEGKSFVIRANALAIPSDNAALFYCAALTDSDDRIKELISPVVANYSYNSGNLPADFTCQVKDAEVREGNRIRIVTSYDKKRWSIVAGENDSVCDRIEAVGNKVVYHSINMPHEIEGAVIQGAADRIVRGLPLTLKVTPVSVDDRITVAVNGINKIVDAAVANLSIPAVTEDLDVAVQVVPAGADAYTVVNVREGELAAKIERCPTRLKVIGVMTSQDFKAFGDHASTITDLDLADVTIKGNGDLANAIPASAFAPSSATVSSALKGIILPAGLVNIEGNAFNRCARLSEISIPKSVAYVGSGAFVSCLGLKKIVMLGNIPPATGSMTPFPSHSITLEVPHGSEGAYNSAEFWKDMVQATSKRYFNIQIDPERMFNVYPDRSDLSNIEYPGKKVEVAIGLPCFQSDYKDNPIYRPGVAFKLYHNGKDKTYTWFSNGQYTVYFDPSYQEGSIRYPQNHVLDAVFHYAISFDKPEFVGEEMVGLADDERWENVNLSKFGVNSTEKPTLYREGRDYRFRLKHSAPNATLRVVAKSRILTKPGAIPSYSTVEQLLVADDNGIYTIQDLQGDTRVTVTSSVAVEDGMVMTADELSLVDGNDASDIMNISVSGDVDEKSFGNIRGKFDSLETLDLSGMTNGSIPADALNGMPNLKSVVLPDNVVSVGGGAFANCPNLESVTLPGVTYVGPNAFDGCGSITSIMLLGQNGTAEAGSGAMLKTPSAQGVTEASFAGMNPNCLIFVPEGQEMELSGSLNVIVNGAGSRTAVSDIALHGDHPFNAPASFNLADHTISLTVNIPGSISGDCDGWRGIVVPFVPESYEFGREFTQRGDRPLTLLSFADEYAEALTEAGDIMANRPYLANVHAPVDTVPVTFKARGGSGRSGDVFDVPFTPESGDIVAGGRNLSLYGCFGLDAPEQDIYILDEKGSAFVRAGHACSAGPFSTYMRSNGGNAPDSLAVGVHPVWVFNPAASEVSGARLYRSSKIGLGSATSGARIVYTLDGSDPKVNGEVYAEPFNIDADSVTVRAIALLKGNESEISEFAYTLRKSSVEYPFAEGWNWISHNVETGQPLSCVMGDNVDRVLSQTREAIRDPKLGIVGTLKTLAPLETYKVYASGECGSGVVNGISYDPANPVSIKKGWNWIGCPVEDGSLDIDDLLSGFEAVEGDMVVSREGFAQYDGDGRWIGTLGQLRPGEGYMLLSAADKDLVFTRTPLSGAAPSASQRIADMDASVCGWNVESGRYPSVMPVISRIAEDGMVVNDIAGYRIGAFCGDECRGLGRIVDGYMMVSVYGNPGDRISFRIYSACDRSETALPGDIAFSEDPLGSLSEPHLFDASTSSATVLDGGHYTVSVENGVVRVNGDTASVTGIEIFDMDGMIVAVGRSELRAGHLVPGVYLIKICADGRVMTHKVNVR